MRIPRPDETFIVRVRRRDGVIVVEQPRLDRRCKVDDAAEVGAVIGRWLDPAHHDRDDAGEGSEAGAT